MSWPDRITWAALTLAIGLVLGRAAMPDNLRDAFHAVPGATNVSRSPGPVVAISLDLLCCLPAALVLLRRAFDKTFSLRPSWSFLALLLLSARMLQSTFWAADKFAAVINAFHWTAAMALMWAMAQLVRDWRQLRLVAVMCFSLLPVYVITGFVYKFQELPETRKYFDENQDQTLAEQNMVKDSFAAKMFTQKLNNGEMMGYFQSANTFGAAISLLLMIGAGLLIQQFIDRDSKKWGLPTAGLMLLLGLIIMGMTRSRGAFATLVIVLLLLVGVWKSGGWLMAHRRGAFWGGVVAIVLLFNAVIGHGIYHGSLPTNTLTFRWHYWVGAAHMVRAHLMQGVGWANFGSNYLAFRLPIAPEEVKDPHNFLVRIVAETGIIGGGLLIAWLLRLWWELSRPTVALPAANSTGPTVVKFTAATAGLAALIWLTLGSDWVRGAPEDFLLKRLLFMLTMVLTASLLALRSLQTQASDDRPAPWVLLTMTLAIAGFLIHNLIDFSLFETGPMFLFALVTGSVLGIRQPAETSPRRGRPMLLAAVIICLAIIGLGLFLLVPTMTAESTADDADDLIRHSKREEPIEYAQHTTAAMKRLMAAFADQPLNAEYALRAAEYGDAALQQLPRQAAGITTVAAEVYSQLRPAIDAAVAADRNSLNARTIRAKIDVDPDAKRADLAAAIALDPNNVLLRLQVGDMLASLGTDADRQVAIEQYREALRYNSLLAPGETKRLTQTDIDKVQTKINAMQR